MKSGVINGKKLEVWEKDNYYTIAHLGSTKVNLGMRVLKKLSNSASNILDLGCGEGTRLSIVARDKKGTGVDISKKALSLARKKYPRLTFKQEDLEELTFEKNTFDLTYSAFVLEHTQNPEKVISEAIRVTAIKGFLVFIAPNFGSPNRASPNYTKSRSSKLILGFLKDFGKSNFNIRSLDWERVEPAKDSELYFPDSDTTVEPYILTLMGYLKSQDVSIKSFSTCWEEELPGAKLHQKAFRVLAKLNIYPFVFWGPQLVVVGQKIK